MHKIRIIATTAITSLSGGRISRNRKREGRVGPETLGALSLNNMSVFVLSFHLPPPPPEGEVDVKQRKSRDGVGGSKVGEVSRRLYIHIYNRRKGESKAQPHTKRGS